MFLGAVFLFAAYAKAIDPEELAEEMRAEGLAVPLPAVALIALALEAGLGTALLLAGRRL